MAVAASLGRSTVFHWLHDKLALLGLRVTELQWTPRAVPSGGGGQNALQSLAERLPVDPDPQRPGCPADSTLPSAAHDNSLQLATSFNCKSTH